MLLNIFFGLLVVGITVVIQAYGTNIWLERLSARLAIVSDKRYRRVVVRLLIFTSSFLIFMHLVQAAVWACLYLLVPEINEFETFEKAIYFSLVTFTTLGYGEITINSSGRILAGLEAINGIILIGWSTAFMFSVYQELLKRSHVDRKRI